MKSVLENSLELWKHAANLADPHPIATVHAALAEDDGLVKAFKTKWPYVAAKIYTTLGKEYAHNFAECLPQSTRFLAYIIEDLLSNGKWKEAADTLLKFDIGMTEVRASALAVCILFSDVAGFDESAQFFREELEDILTIDVGHFKEVKDTLRNISNMWNTEIKENEIPSGKNVLIAARWVVNNANTAEKVVDVSNFANQI
ncbi:hypothetical protein TVAG_046110 [Trichomonas vaginalis G3]|uniref:Uncharacterized protein n=1 Tax=Trichomonas vaginalis (strain ATCC PRA-98 / G3) TaxID=412133 RepID=A2DMI1_TRIV3|nr:hypothetical protein TVAGG3_0336560 [Trichomonas vaginalis G3]EAY18408.1 hypothetical protein TVAG_046110 [Trichomonas vaginalis G3]KAI5530317.1 hypothetical protein TVAGG3_0336560 [Trichomonas vaginalis G3]|eukprot:XP_001579394.1 hypothetical protein [Trichomonas vaginalis G3]